MSLLESSGSVSYKNGQAHETEANSLGSVSLEKKKVQEHDEEQT